jgi:sortase A
MITKQRMAALVAILLLLGGAALSGHGLFIRAKAVVAQVLLERAWAQTLETRRPVKAWAWADTWPVARLVFPKLGGEALAFGPAHVAVTPLPGENGTSVIAGHRDTHFDFIKDLQIGDEIVVTTRAGKTATFRMTGSAIVHAQASGIDPAGKAPRLALVTCYPFDAVERAPLRYVVFAEEAGK